MTERDKKTAGDWRQCNDPECREWKTCTKAYACLATTEPRKPTDWLPRLTVVNSKTGERKTFIFDPPKDGRIYAMRPDGTYVLAGGQML